MKTFRGHIPKLLLLLLLNLFSQANSASAQTGPTRIGSQITWTSTGEMALFSRGVNNALYFQQRSGIETPTPWTWTYPKFLDGVIKGNPVALFDGDGKLLVVARGTDDTLFFRKETAVGNQDFTWWGQIPDYEVTGGDVPRFAGDPSMVRGRDGKLALYSVAIDGAVWRSEQRGSAQDFAGFTSLGKPNGQEITSVTAAINNNGLQLIAVTTKQRRAFVRFQTPEGQWDDWLDIGGSFEAKDEKSVLSFAVEKNGRLTLFGNNSAGTVSFATQTGIGAKTWTPWNTLIGGAHGSESRPAVSRQEDGSLAVFFWANYGSSLDWQYQKSPNSKSWSNWNTMHSPIKDAPLSITDGRGIIHIFALDQEGTWHELMQDKANSTSWSDWHLGNMNPT